MKEKNDNSIERDDERERERDRLASKRIVCVCGQDWTGQNRTD